MSGKVIPIRPGEADALQKLGVIRFVTMCAGVKALPGNRVGKVRAASLMKVAGHMFADEQVQVSVTGTVDTPANMFSQMFDWNNCLLKVPNGNEEEAKALRKDFTDLYLDMLDNEKRLLQEALPHDKP